MREESHVNGIGQIFYIIIENSQTKEKHNPTDKWKQQEKRDKSHTKANTSEKLLMETEHQNLVQCTPKRPQMPNQTTLSNKAISHN